MGPEVQRGPGLWDKFYIHVAAGTGRTHQRARLNDVDWGTRSDRWIQDSIMASKEVR